MREGTRSALLGEGRAGEEIVQRAVSAARDAPLDERVTAGLEAVVDIAETDPVAARSALSDLRGDHERLSRLEACLGGGAARATFGLGAAIQVALAELGCARPDLRSRMAELERWLKGTW